VGDGARGLEEYLGHLDFGEQKRTVAESGED
jgi:hypothetical protein